MPLFFCKQKKSRKTVKEKFYPLLYSLELRTSAVKALVFPFAARRSRFGLRCSRVRGRRQSKFPAAPATGGARNFYPGGFFNTPCAPDRQRRLRAGQGYYFNAAARGAGLLRRQSRGWLGIYKIARQNTFVLYDYIKKALSNQDKADFSEKNIKTSKTLTSR